MTRRLLWLSISTVVLVWVTRTIALRVATDDFRTCVFPVKAECLPDGLTNKGGWVAGGWRLVTGRDRVDLRDALRNAGLLFPFGSYAEYDPSDQSIVVLNTTNNIDHVRSYLVNRGLEPAVKMEATVIEVTDRQWLEAHRFDVLTVDELGTLTTNQYRMIRRDTGVVSSLKGERPGEVGNMPEEHPSESSVGSVSNDTGTEVTMQFDPRISEDWRYAKVKFNWQARTPGRQKTDVMVVSVASEVVLTDGTSMIYRLDHLGGEAVRGNDTTNHGTRLLIVTVRWSCASDNDTRKGSVLTDER